MNTQQTIVKGIKEQLFKHDYLVLPNFGGFVLKHQAAHFSISGGMLIPASKTVSFNIQLKQNDGVLALWLQQKINCSASEALNHLLEFANYCTSILTTKRRLSIEAIGFFYLDFENNICFEPTNDSNFLTSSFGFSSISIKEMEIEQPETKKESVFVDRVLIAESNKVPIKKRNYRFIVPAFFSVILFSLLILLVSNTKITGNLKSAVFGNTVKSKYHPINYSELKINLNTITDQDYVADANGIANLRLEASKNFAVKVIEAAALPDRGISLNKKTNKTVSKSNYEIVLGCFTILTNAKRMANNLATKNIDVSISEKNEKGMHVVSLGNFNSKEDALKKLEELKNNYPKAWIKKPF